MENKKSNKYRRNWTPAFVWRCLNEVNTKIHEFICNYENGRSYIGMRTQTPAQNDVYDMMIPCMK